MAAKYSSLYEENTAQSVATGAFTTSSSYSYVGPKATRKQQTCTIRGTYNLANGALGATNTTLTLAEVPAGSKMIRLTISSGDDDVDSDNDFTFDLGWTATPTTFLSASTVLQGGAETVYVSEELEELAASAAGDSLILTRAAGATNSTGTIYFLAEYINQ
jgi:hypothetical protein